MIAWHRAVHREITRTLRSLPDDFHEGTLRSEHWPSDLVGHARGHREQHLERSLTDRPA